MKLFIGLALFGALLVSCAAQTTITIQQPTATTSTSPMAVAATVNTPVQALQLYVDGKKLTESLTTSLTGSVSLSLGQHRLAFQAIDKYKNVTKTVKYVTITQPLLPTTAFANQQESSSWQTCGNCGNNGAQGKVATYTMTRGLTSPTLDGTSTSAQFSIGGPYPYTNGYWFLRHTAPTTNLKTLVYDFYLYVPVESAKAPQAIEFECQHTVNYYVHNFAWQADYASKVWRTFDYTNNKWVPTTVAFAGFTPGTWHHIVAQYHEEGANTVHDALTVDGVRSVVNITRAGTPTTQSGASFTNAFQLDLNGVPTAYSVFVDKMTVSYQ
jgi:hypothetical protein